MRPQLSYCFRNRRGLALTAAMFSLVAVSLLAAGMFSVSDLGAKASRNREDASHAMQLAEAAVAHSVGTVRRELRRNKMSRLLRGNDSLPNTADDGLLRIGTPWLRLLWLNITVGADQARGRHDRTPEHLRRALQLCRELGDAPALLYTLSALAIELVLTDRLEDAAQLFGAAEAHGRRTGQRISDPLTLQLLQAHRAQATEALAQGRFHACVELGASAPLEALLQSYGGADISSFPPTTGA